MIKNFTQFSVMDFAEEDSFIRWARRGDPEATAFWEQWLKEHPEKNTAAMEAYRLVRSIQVQETTPSPETLEALWSSIDQATPISQTIPTPTGPRLVFRTWLPYAAAASIAILLFFLFNRPSKNIVVKNGDQMALVLPDGSRVLANAGSSLEYRPGKWGRERLIHLSGEAFFEVKKGKPFIVETKQGTVEVLGTRFNVQARANGFKVDCLSGKVRVTGRSKTSRILTAGLSTNQSENGILADAVPLDTNLIGAWRDGRFFFADVTLQEVLEEIERQFDVKVQTSPEIFARRTTTFFERDNLDSALYKVCWPMQLEARRKGKIVEIK
jgi:transmembrane sensor